MRKEYHEVSNIRFIEPMLLLQTDKLPEGAAWLHEIKIDGYRAIAGRSGDRILFRSRRDFTSKFPSIAKTSAACLTKHSLTVKWRRSTSKEGHHLISFRITNPREQRWFISCLIS
jgi:hypothetical protein